MIDVQFLREQTDEAKKALARKRVDPKLVDKFLRVDQNWRAKRAALDSLQAEQKIVSKTLAGGKNEEMLSKAQILKDRIAEVTDSLADVEKKREALLEEFPNPPFADVPNGADASGNKVLREEGKKPEFDFAPKDYLAIAENLGLVDLKQAAIVSGSRFNYLLRDAALLEFALIKLAFDVLVENKFIPVITPVLIKPEVYRRMGRLASDQKEERYHFPKDDLYLIGSTEHTIGPLHMDGIIPEEELPKRYVGFSTWFRREAGSYGKDVKGILRSHQFDGVEMYSFVKPEEGEKELQFLVSMQEKLMQALEVPYRVVEVCTGEMGWTDARQYDIEAWMPGQGVYRETHTADYNTTFQSRGMNVKYKNTGGKSDFVHTLDATAFAIGRTLIALIENHQTKKGTVKVPKALQPYLGKKEIGIG